MIDIRLHAYLRAHAQANGAERVGPFVASFDAHSAHPYRNYAVPDDQARPDAGQVEALIAMFTVRGRTPRLEYLPGLCPAVEPALLAAGFTAERRLAVMACAPGRCATSRLRRVSTSALCTRRISCGLWPRASANWPPSASGSRSAAEERIYRRVGYTRTTEILHIPR